MEKKNIVFKEIMKGILFLIVFYIWNSFSNSIKFNNDVIHLVSISKNFKAENIFIETYRAYIMFFLRIGHFFLLTYLVKTLYTNKKNKNIFMGALYFAIGIFFENIGLILPFEILKNNVYIFGVMGYILGSLNLLNYFLNKIQKSEKLQNGIEYSLIAISGIFMGFSKLDILVIKDFLNVYLGGMTIFFIIYNFFLFFYKKDLIEKKESLIFSCAFGIEFMLYMFLSKFFQLSNFEIISLIVLNFIMVDLKREEFQRKKEINRNLNTSYLRILLVFIVTGIFSRILELSGMLTLFLSILIIGELLFFTFSIEEDYNLQVFDNLLKKARLIETTKKMKQFLEDNLTKYFRLVDIKVVFYPISLERKNNEKDYVNFNVEYNKIKYDLEVKLIENSKEIGKIYAKDSCLLLNKTKLKRFLYLIERLTPVLENLMLKEIQVEYYKSNKNEMLEKIEELEKENYYLKEIVKLNSKKEDKR